MVPLSFSTSFRFVMVLFIFLTIKGSIAHSDDQAKRTTVVNDARNGYAISLSVEKEVMDDVPAPAAAELNKYGGMRGRKMMIERKNTKEKSKQVESKNSSSGNSNSPSNLLGESRKNTQNQMKGDESKKTAKTASRRNWKNSSDKLVSTDDQSDEKGSFQNLDSEKIHEDTTEFFTMMNKDYVGGPGSGSKPHHKPPINNSQPFHRSNP
ncbi:uncharacterized protein LOC107865926 [Capsicum annuum]|uniref:uncharacterized protein LOC107865926 n=1 Tax=Capsicum annuum TaxID=4072 RepID=UPI0007BF37CE|nr:uncharacterized protein LOC107865926 [Capsicum annuum]